MRCNFLWILLAVTAGCGTAPADPPTDAGPGCVAVGSDHYCYANHPCCGGGWCDPSTSYCRDPGACGLRTQGCDDTHGCCTDLSCQNGVCSQSQNPTGGNTSGGVGGNGSGCQSTAQACGANADCCSGFCANGQCASVQGNGTNGNTNGHTSGNTSGCSGFPAGTSCSSGSQCCSGTCTSQGFCG